MNTQSPLGKYQLPKHWASEHIEKLQAGEIVQIRPSGRSMEPIIQSGALVTVRPHDGYVTAENIVLVSCKDNTFLHRVGAVAAVGTTKWYRIENASGRSNGWVTLDEIHGVVARVEP